MYIDRVQRKVKGKVYTHVLLRRSVRVGKKVVHHTVANLSHCTPEEIAAVEVALRHKNALAALRELTGDAFEVRQGVSIGAVWLLYEVAQRIGITAALGNSPEGRLELWCAVLGLEPFTEDHLYANLAWLAQEQAHLEQRLYRHTPRAPFPGVVLYDETSTYLEGQCHELAAWGYNRDGKRSKQQIVIGLVCDTAGRPLSIEVFRGNSADVTTVAPQIKKVAEQFGAQHVTFVGDRSILKQALIAQLAAHGMSYIGALTKPQIERLVREGVVQMELFDDELHEVWDAENGRRYVLRRNPQRAAELRATRADKLATVQRAAEQATAYLHAHPRAQTATARRCVQQRVRALGMESWVKVAVDGRVLRVEVDEAARTAVEQLDGWYVLHSNVPAAHMNAAGIHACYKDLAQMEAAFCMLKTAYLEVRRVYVRREERTRGHALVMMLSLRLVQALQTYWADEDMTVAEGLARLSQLCVNEIVIKGRVVDWSIPEPRADVQRLLTKAGVKLPRRIAPDGRRVHTNTRLRRTRVRN